MSRRVGKIYSIFDEIDTSLPPIGVSIGMTLIILIAL